MQGVTPPAAPSFERAALVFLRKSVPGTPVPDAGRSTFRDGVWIFRDADGRLLGAGGKAPQARLALAAAAARR